MVAERAPVARPDAQLVLASWPAFQRALTSLGSMPADAALRFTAIQGGAASRKQVTAALRVLGLVDENDVADFRLRRAAKGDYSAVTDAVADRFPAVAAAIETGDEEVMRATMESLAVPASSKTRFWRFVRAAHQAAHGTQLPALTFSSLKRAPRARPVGTTQTDDPVARHSLEAELAAYQSALPRLLATDLNAAAVVSDRLRELRKELRQPSSAGSSGP